MWNLTGRIHFLMDKTLRTERVLSSVLRKGGGGYVDPWSFTDSRGVSSCEYVVE